MPTARQIQDQIKELLSLAGIQASVEWTSSRDADDGLRSKRGIYVPRPDVAVRPMNISPGPDSCDIESADKKMKNVFPEFAKLTHGLSKNNNPRCLLAIEVVHSGSSKHVLGDFTNAGMLGYYGLIVASDKMLPEVQRINKYLCFLRNVNKAAHDFLTNVVIIPENDLEGLFKKRKTKQK